MKRLLILLFLMSQIFSISIAQGKSTLKILISPAMESVYDEAYFSTFETTYNVDVVIVKDNQSFNLRPPGFTSIAEYLSRVEEFANKADILSIQSFDLKPESVRAGFWLNIAPFVNSDADIQPSSYYEAAWKTFNFDNGSWGLPTSIEPQLLAYEPAAFDQAGLPYPSESWTLEQFAQAARILTKFDTNGNPVRIGFFGDITPILRSVLGHNLYSEHAGLSSPDLVDADLAEMIEMWAPVQEEISPKGEYIAKGAPFRLTGVYAFASNNPINNSETMLPALLPGGFAMANINGFVINAKTDNPELAYYLIKYLSLHPLSAYISIGQYAARHDIELLPSEAGQQLILTPQTQSVIYQGMTKLLSEGDMRYFDYALAAMRELRLGKNGITTLSETQERALDNLRISANQQLIGIQSYVPQWDIALLRG